MRLGLRGPPDGDHLAMLCHPQSVVALNAVARPLACLRPTPQGVLTVSSARALAAEAHKAS
jgi:hypothetical protein